jgi:hypothetical protein
MSLLNILFYFKNFNRFLQSQKWHENNAFVKQFIAKFSHFSKSPFIFVTSTRKFQGAQPVRWRAVSMWRECRWPSCSGPTPYPAGQGSPLQTEQCHHPILSANIKASKTEQCHHPILSANMKASKTEQCHHPILSANIKASNRRKLDAGAKDTALPIYRYSQRAEQHRLSIKGTQVWEFLGLRFLVLYFFLVSYA